MTRRAVVAALAGSLLAAACAGPAPGGRGGADPSPPRFELRDRGLPVVDEPPFAGDGQLVEPRPTAWEHASVASDDRTVTLTYWGGNVSCYGAMHVQAEYRDGEVVVTLYTGRADLPEGVVCTQEAMEKRAVTKLREPVAGRRLADGSV